MLALVAGRGRLPELVAAAAAPDVVICSLEDQVPDVLQPEITFRLETLGSFLLELGKRGVSDVCFCGAIDRPRLDPARLDAETAPLVPLLQGALGQGDDGALRAVIGLFEKTGFTVRGAHELTPEVLLAESVPTQRAIRKPHDDDARVASAILSEMAEADQGQACVVRKRTEIAREDARGTDAMLEDLKTSGLDAPPELWVNDTAELTAAGWNWLGDLRKRNHNGPAAGAILFKAPKPGQDRRADLPTIGPDTALGAACAGFDGIVIEAEGVIVLEGTRVVTLLDAMQMFLWARKA